MLKLTDPGLFRQQAYIAGAWVDADSGRTVAVSNPATGELLGTVPMCGTPETARAIAAADVAQRAWRDVPAKERAAILRRLNDLMLANADDLALIMTSRAGQAAGRGQGRDRLCRVASSSGSPTRRAASMATRSRRTSSDKPHPGDQAADRRHGGDHALELPRRDAHAQGRPGAGRRLLDGGQAGVADAVLGARARRAGRARRRAARACSSVLTGSAGADRRRDDAQPAGAQAQLHRLDRGRAAR